MARKLSYVLLLGILIFVPTVAAQQSSISTETIHQEDDMPWYSVFFTEPVETYDPIMSEENPALIETELLTFINSAEETLDIAIFEIDLPSAVTAIIDAYERGVDVRVIVDDEFGMEDEDSLASQLVDAGIPVKTDERSALMHHSFMLVDGLRVWVGINPTINSIYKNNGVALLLDNTFIGENYQTIFNAMFDDENFNQSGVEMPFTIPIIENIPVETYFIPHNTAIADQRIVDLIEGAKISVYVSAFSFTMEPIGTALLDQYANGLDIQVLGENRGSTTSFSQLPRLACAGVPVYTDGNPNTFDEKIIVVDSESVIISTGSFSNTAFTDNDENILILHSTEFASVFIEEFERQLEIAQPMNASELECE